MNPRGHLVALRRFVLIASVVGMAAALANAPLGAIGPSAGLVGAAAASREPTVQSGQGPGGQAPLDPTAWGGNHAGKPIPDYVHGDECLFCHRNDIGPEWQKNAHGITVREREDAPTLTSVLKAQPALSSIASQVEYFLGSRHRVRFMKKAGYGKFALLSTQAELDASGHAAGWEDLSRPVWDGEKFANQCAGCHTTAVDPKTRAFSAFGLDCYTCHGNVNLEHTGDTSLIFLSKKSKKDPKAIESTCASCHLRMGTSKSTGLPYANNFVPGDNLFQDYQVEFSKADDPALNPGDRHVLRNVRDVVLYGKDFPTCVNCHQIHTGSSVKHRRMPSSPICADCHIAGADYKGLKHYSVTSKTCEY
ncbi:MAG TPA: hypothetical protein VJX67_03430 [Blastocatellia bacterium]|nr:hypothetical protein [Blastocatellia bacterium]